MFAVLGGLRRGELLGLCWSDVDFDGECVIVRRSLTPVSGRVLVLGPTKTHQERRVDLGPIGLAALRQQSTQQAAQRRRREGVYSDRYLVFANAPGPAAAGQHGAPVGQGRVRASGSSLLGECPIEPRIAEGDSQLAWVH